jgi:hypothetical protein
MRNWVGTGLLVATALTVAGCGMFGGSKEAKLVCPVSFIAPDADKLAAFNPGGVTLSDVRYGVIIDAVNSRCSRADHGIIVDTKVEFRLVSRDPSLRNGNFVYFVSVVDSNHDILTKRTYTVPFEFGPRLQQLTKNDELIENLPLHDVGTGGSYAVVVGLQLTEAQLRFNRAAAHSPAVALPPAAPVALPPRPRNSASSP